MSQVDFAVAFLLIISVITYSVASTSNKLTGDFAVFSEKTLGESASYLSKQMLDVHDQNSLVSNFRKIQASFSEVGMYPHTETISMTVTPVLSKVHVYDRFWNEISATISSNGVNETISFSLDFSSAEKKHVNIFYDGAATSGIDYAGATNITGIILSEEDVYVMSQQRCSNLKNMTYNEARSKFGFTENLNISECDYGLSPPSSANVIVKSIPVLAEKEDGTIYASFVRIKVW
ncbi:MAG: hypothetical protein V1678_01530 [Candidatus Aenigmatarchaeota archaeon]